MIQYFDKKSFPYYSFDKKKTFSKIVTREISSFYLKKKSILPRYQRSSTETNIDALILKTVIRKIHQIQHFELIKNRLKCRTNRTGWKLDFSLPMENFATLDRNLRQTKYLTLTPKCYLTWTGAGSCSNDFPWEYRKQFLGWWRPGTAGEWLVGVGCCLARCSSSNTAHISSVTRKCGQLSRGYIVRFQIQRWEIWMM